MQILTGGVAAPPTIPAGKLDTNLPDAVLIKRIAPPEGYLHADVCKFYDEGERLFVVWDDGGVQGNNLACSYKTSDGSKEWEQLLTGSISNNDIAWDAKSSDKLLYLRTRNGEPELSKWDKDGRLWETTDFDTTPHFSWCGGISGAGTRSMIAGFYTPTPAGWDTHLLDAADESISATINPGSSFDAVAALSRDGDVILTKHHGPGFTVYRHSTSLTTHTNVSALLQSFDMVNDPTPPGPVALSADGAEGIVLDDVSNIVYCLTGGPASYTQTKITLPNKPRACALSSDGETAVVVSRSADIANGGLLVTIIDMTGTPSIALDGGLPIQYSVLNPNGTAHGLLRFLGITDDGSEIGLGTFQNHDPVTGQQHSVALRASTSKRSYQRLFVPEQNARVWCGDYETSDGSLMAIAPHQPFTGPQPHKGYVELLSLPAAS